MLFDLSLCLDHSRYKSICKLDWASAEWISVKGGWIVLLESVLINTCQRLLPFVLETESGVKVDFCFRVNNACVWVGHTAILPRKTQGPGYRTVLRGKETRGKRRKAAGDWFLIDCLLPSSQQLYAAQLATMQMSPGPKMAPLPQAHISSGPLSPSNLKNDKRSSSPITHIKVRPVFNDVKGFVWNVRAVNTIQKGLLKTRLTSLTYKMDKEAEGKDSWLFSRNKQLRIRYMCSVRGTYSVSMVWSNKHRPELKESVSSEYLWWWSVYVTSERLETWRLLKQQTERGPVLFTDN